MINLLLLLLFMGYFLSLGVAFLLHRKRSKESLRTLETKLQPRIRHAVQLIAVFFTLLFGISALELESLLFFSLLCVHLAVMGYLFAYWKKGRCWREHRMVFYTFLLVPALYLSAEANDAPLLLLFSLLLYIYLILDFQFASFSPKTLWWD